jgi:hypothetical protein
MEQLKKDTIKAINYGRWVFFRLFFAAIPVFLLLIAISLVAKGCGWIAGVAEHVASPDAAISSYEWFEQQYRDVHAIEWQIKDAQDAVKRFKDDNGKPSDWAFDQREEYGRLNSHVTGLKQARRGMIEVYNARASMITRNLWKSSTLPQHIED